MDEELKISKNLEEQEIQQDNVDLGKALEEEAPKGEGKVILMTFLVIVGVVALTIGGWNVYNNITSADVINIDDLHKENLEGNLDNEEGYIYNGFSVIKADDLWWTEVNRFGTLVKIPLRFGPKEVESIPMSGRLSPEFNKGEEVYISISPNVTNRFYTLAISELSFNVVQGIDRKPVGAWSEENNWGTDHTIVSCKNNPDNLPVIELAFENETKIEMIGSCILIQGQDEEIAKATEKVLYKWYGVIS